MKYDDFLPALPGDKHIQIARGTARCSPLDYHPPSPYNLYGLSDLLPGEIHLTVPRTAFRHRQSVRLHTKRLSPEEVIRREGLPVTTVTRTLTDVILDGLSEELVEQAVQEALARGLITKNVLLEDALRCGGRAARVVQDILNRRNADEIQR